MLIGLFIGNYQKQTHTDLVKRSLEISLDCAMNKIRTSLKPLLHMYSDDTICTLIHWHDLDLNGATLFWSFYAVIQKALGSAYILPIPLRYAMPFNLNII